ncbi:thioredoxin family protein [Tunicatimonas pelagia]|uniref:thioredoxin family protein n=1 Tax=Tunicatimonas pelagia TaxID=931531 RepID=UPI0026652EF3|nr:thioredoxin fold domain-containing protein [Tunicatimonas pelagia]WKN43107.1 thioredoxin family protein [Tunicatimonas pelagia]
MIQKPCKIVGCFIAVSLFLCAYSSAQEAESVRWLTFEQLEDSLATNCGNDQPKKVFIDFYTDWCTYCRKMDKVVFTKPEVINVLNEYYYAVRFDAETKAEIAFGGQIFINDQIGKFRTPIHQIAQLLALKKGQFAPPTLVILDEDFNVTARYFEYLNSKQLLNALR